MRKQNKQFISVIMPVYNAADYLVEAIESIRWQTYPYWELICVDDGSTDESLKILKKFAKRDKRIKVFRLQEHKGLAAALNFALKKAKGEYIARMDTDDISLPKRLQTQLNYLKRNKNLVAIGCQAALINESDEIIGQKTFPTNAKTLYEIMMVMVPIQHPTLFTYAKLLKKCGYSNHDTAEDVSMMFKLLQYGDFGNVDKVLFRYRIRKDSNSLKNPKKTFYLTLRSRIKAILKWNYQPSVKGVFINIVQFILVSALPKKAILFLYEFIRFNKLPLRLGKIKLLWPAY